MKGQIIKHIIITGLTLSFISTAYASMSLPNGWYIEGDAGTSNISNKSYGSGSSTDASGFGWGANIGYKFMPYFAGEIGYTHYADVTVTALGSTAGRDRHYSYDIAGKGIVPISTSGVELFAKLGIARLNSNVNISNAAAASAINLNSGSHNATGVLMGLGADYSFMPELSGVVQWTRVKGNSNTGDADLYSLGLNFIFD